MFVILFSRLTSLFPIFNCGYEKLWKVTCRSHTNPPTPTPCPLYEKFSPDHTPPPTTPPPPPRLPVLQLDGP